MKKEAKVRAEFERVDTAGTGHLDQRLYLVAVRIPGAVYDLVAKFREARAKRVTHIACANHSDTLGRLEIRRSYTDVICPSLQTLDRRARYRHQQ